MKIKKIVSIVSDSSYKIMKEKTGEMQDGK